MTITLTGESEGVGFIDGKFMLDPSVPIHNSGIIKVVDPIDRIFVVNRAAVEDGVSLSDTLAVITDTLNVSLGSPINAALLGIDDDEGKIYDIGGFWTFEQGATSYIVDSTYSGVYPNMRSSSSEDSISTFDVLPMKFS